MSNAAILEPVVGMFVLTFLVWTYRYIRRIAYMRRERIHPQQVRSPERKSELILWFMVGRTAVRLIGGT